MTTTCGNWQFSNKDPRFKKVFDVKNLVKPFPQLFKKGDSVAITEYLDDRLVLFFDLQTQTEAIESLVNALESAHKLKNKEEFYQAILNREKLVSTGIGLGVAIPHAKLPNYESFFIAIAVQTAKGIEWNSLDGAPVQLIFMIGGPNNKQTEYLNILSQLTLAIKNNERRRAILKSTSAKQVIDLFKGC
jgi:nitrogen PTS system EIIA component